MKTWSRVLGLAIVAALVAVGLRAEQINTSPSGSCSSCNTWGDIGTRVYNTANESISNATSTALTFDSERWDTNTMHEGVTHPSRITFVTAGKYSVWCGARFAAAANGFRDIWILLNGATDLVDMVLPADATNGNNMAAQTVYSFAANDYIECMVYQNSTGALNIIASGNSSLEFAAQLLAK